MTPRLRKFSLIMHSTVSVGWLGAVVPYLALAIAGLISHDAQMVRAAYLSMELIGWFVIVPFSLAALSSGLIQSLGTQWGLFRHWWILAKFLLITIATIILLQHMQEVSRISRVAAETAFFGADFRAQQIQLFVHPAGGLLVLLAVMTLSVLKPWGMTPYGRRRASEPDLPSHRRADATLVREPVFSARGPRMGRIIGIHAIVLVLLFIVILHISDGGMRHH